MFLFGKGWARSFPYLGMLPGLLIYLLFFLGPSVTTIFLSFTNISGIPGTAWKFVGLDNYIEFFSAGRARDNLDALRRTFIFAASVTVIQNLVALVLALILNSRVKGHLIYRSLIFMPVILGVTVTGLVWTLVFNPLDGPAQKALSLFGQSSGFFGDTKLAFWLVIFVQIWMALGYAMVIFLSGLQSISGELYEAARIDGSNIFQSFRFVTLPLLAPTITVNVVLAIIGSLQTYQIIYILTNGQQNTSVLGLVIFQTAFGTESGVAGGSLRQGYAASLATIEFGLVLLVTLLFQFYLRRREVQL